LVGGERCWDLLLALGFLGPEPDTMIVQTPFNLVIEARR